MVINNQPIQWNPDDGAARYLGVYLDKILTWKKHINNKLKKTMPVLK